MSASKLGYVDLLEANNAIQIIGEDTYWLCVTRTVQESKLFPVPSYMLLSYLMCFYRYPELLRKMETKMSAEEIGDRARIIGGKAGALTAWAMPTFYLIGREILINFGMLRPEDCAEDVAYVMNFWRRFQLARQREDGHLNAREFGQRSQPLPERQLQVFHADLHRCAPSDRLHHAANAFMAAASQYGFLVACESRVVIDNSGPYKLGADRELLMRTFTDLAEGSYPWLDGVAADVPYNTLTVTMEVRDCHFYLVDDWASFESRPEFTADKLCGVGLYTCDPLSDGPVPVGMESAEKLAETFEMLTERCKEAMAKLWRNVATWSRDQMMDAGAIIYFSIIRELAHIAGTYDPEDWLTVDPRAARFRVLFNDEFGREMLGELVGYLTNSSQQTHEYFMMQHNDQPRRYLSALPYALLDRDDWLPRIGPVQKGTSHHPAKADVFQTSAGRISAADYNAKAQASQPIVADPASRNFCDSWAKYHADDADVNALYKRTQERSRNLAGKGAGLRQADVEALRG